MLCSACGGTRVAFSVPDSLRPYAPEESSTASLCTDCLRIEAVDDVSVDPPVAVDWDPLPSGEAGVAMALLFEYVDSLARYRDEVTALVAHVETAGGDPFLTFDRLSSLIAAGGLDPDFDLDRRAAQLQSLLD